jgi:hypothetical protein
MIPTKAPYFFRSPDFNRDEARQMIAKLKMDNQRIQTTLGVLCDSFASISFESRTELDKAIHEAALREDVSAGKIKMLLRYAVTAWPVSRLKLHSIFIVRSARVFRKRCKRLEKHVF